MSKFDRVLSWSYTWLFCFPLMLVVMLAVETVFFIYRSIKFIQLCKTYILTRLRFHRK